MTGRTATAPALRAIDQSETPATSWASTAARNTLDQLRAISRASRFDIIFNLSNFYNVVVRLQRVKPAFTISNNISHYDFLNITAGNVVVAPVPKVPAVANAPVTPVSVLPGNLFKVVETSI